MRSSWLKNRDPDIAQQLATDIAHEAAQLDRTIGGFLAEAKAATAAGTNLRQNRRERMFGSAEKKGEHL